MSKKNSLLEVNNLRTCYKIIQGNVWAVDGVDFSLAAGETMGLVGESGCGKTTIIKSIMRLLPKQASTEGEVLLKGRNLLELPMSEMRKVRWEDIAIISQSAMNALDPVYKIGDQIVEAVRIHTHKSKAEAWERAEELFSLVGIEKSRLKDFPHQFSGGMRQRAIIAMALALNPSVLLADEPTTALDVIVQAQILKRIQQLQKKFNSSMIIVTHDMSVVAETCQKVVVMYAGKVVEAGPVEIIFARPCHPYTMGLKNAFPSIKGEKYELISIPGYPPDLLHPPKGCRFADRCPFALEVCVNEDPPMRELSPGHRVACHNVDKASEMMKKASQPSTWSASQKEG
ncbi:MAG: ABC transporter ATP-binding protein [Desulfitobacteriaceae bacterium]